jgi:hypothetical protein
MAERGGAVVRSQFFREFNYRGALGGTKLSSVRALRIKKKLSHSLEAEMGWCSLGAGEGPRSLGLSGCINFS